MSSNPTDNVNSADALAPQASHDREQGQPGQAKSAFSHANEFKDGEQPLGFQDNAAPADSVEALSADTAAQDKGNSKFMASLEAAKEKQEEAGSTAI